MPNVISDVAGQYNTLQALLKQMPDDEPISIGDMVDRGLQSKEVVEFFMKHGRAVLGNHEHMMLDHQRRTGWYEHGVWTRNGGSTTLRSYDLHVPDEVLDWVERLPRFLEIDGVLVSHAFLHPMFERVLEAALAVDDSPYTQFGENSIIWNRSEPIWRPEYKLQVAGHNSHMGLQWFPGENDLLAWAVCLDASRSSKLTGIHLPSMKIYQQDYIP